MSKFFKVALSFFALLMTVSCAHQAAIPLGNDMMEIDVSAAPVCGRVGAQRMAIEQAAKSTLEMGYDKFIVVNNGGWNETTVGGSSYGSANASVNPVTGNASAVEASSWGTTRHPEAKLVIRMFHNGDKGSAKAVDARKLVGAQENQQMSDYPSQ